MYHYKPELLRQITIYNDNDGEHNYGTTMQSCTHTSIYMHMFLDRLTKL